MIRKIFIALLLVASNTAMSAAPQPIIINKKGLEIRVRPHTPPQMAAFYEARGFPVSAIPELEKACFMTVGVVNNRKDIVWLEPAAWVMKDARGRKVHLFSLKHWKALWRRHRVSAAAETAFRWTQLPQERDLHPQEPVGGNISFTPTVGPYSLTTRFRLGPRKTAGPLEITISGLPCPGRG